MNTALSDLTIRMRSANHDEIGLIQQLEDTVARLAVTISNWSDSAPSGPIRKVAHLHLLYLAHLPCACSSECPRGNARLPFKEGTELRRAPKPEMVGDLIECEMRSLEQCLCFKLETVPNKTLWRFTQCTCANVV
jgi:hypothetical protein